MTTTYDQKPELAQELADLRTRAEAAEQALANFKDRVVEVGLRAAEDNDMCGAYDEVMAELGLPGRERTWTIQVRFHFSAAVAVMARSEEEATEKVNESEIRTYWVPSPPMLAGLSPAGAAFDMSYEVMDD